MGLCGYNVCVGRCWCVWVWGGVGWGGVGWGGGVYMCVYVCDVCVYVCKGVCVCGACVCACMCVYGCMWVCVQLQHYTVTVYYPTKGNLSSIKIGNRYVNLIIK